jgi:chemotaxis protein CheC
MLNKDIKVYLPQILPLHDESAIKAFKSTDKESMISVQCDILAGLNGKLILTFDERSSVKFINLCYPGYPLTEGDVITELGMSALKEVGNIVLSAYVNALSAFLKIVVVPSPPTVALGSMSTIIEAAMADKKRIYVLFIDAIFEKEQEQIKGRMGFLLTSEDKELIQFSCKQSWDQGKPLMNDDKDSAFGDDNDDLLGH